MNHLVRRNDRGDSRLTSGLGSWDPFGAFDELLRWDPFAGLGGLSARTQVPFVPSVELKETKDAFVFKLDVPGMREEDLDISLEGGRLMISGKREEEERHEEDRYYAYERSYGTFTRSFSLPEGCDVERVEAELKDGVLRLMIPKKAEAKPRRIQLGKGSGGAPQIVESSEKKAA